MSSSKGHQKKATVRSPRRSVKAGGRRMTSQNAKTDNAGGDKTTRESLNRLRLITGGRRDQGRRAIAAIDIGGGKAACMIGVLAPLDNGDYEIDVIGVGQHGGLVAERASDVEAALRSAIEAAERMAGERAHRAFVSVRGRSINCRRIGVDLETAGGVVTAEDVRDCLSEARSACTRHQNEDALQNSFSPLHALPMRYRVDGESALTSDAVTAPIGQAGNVLTAEVLSLGVRESAAANLEALIGRCGLELDALVAGPLAAAHSVVLEDERDLGVIMLDLGARSTDFAVYDRGVMTACGAVGLGGEHITRDVAQIFGSSLPQAERIKTLHGSAQSGAGDEHRLLDFPQLADPSEIARHSRAELTSVIAPRLEEIIELAFGAAAEQAGGRHTIRRAVLTGGASLLPGACDMAERIMGVKTRLGRPTSLVGAPDAATAPHFAVCVGLLSYAAQVKAMKSKAGGRNIDPYAFEAETQARAGLGRRQAPHRFFDGVANWLRANF